MSRYCQANCETGIADLSQFLIVIISVLTIYQITGVDIMIS